MDATFAWSFIITACLHYACIAGLDYSVPTETNEYWNTIANAELQRARQIKPNIAKAKNVILFLGDGMGVSTVTAARILKGQLNGKSGEEELLSFEKFPHLGLSKTYNQDSQVADSAGTATAYFCGVKTNLGVIGLDGRSRRAACNTKNGTEVTSILDWSKAAGKSVGILTTARITHATPSALYAHSPERNWESDSDMSDITGGCEDIAKQLVDDNHDIDVIMGGGRVKFLRKNDSDPEIGNRNLTKDGRVDGRNLIEDWKRKQEQAGKTYSYVSTLSDFNKVDPSKTDRLLGLFGYSHMDYDINRDTTGNGDPSLDEMTEKAIQILKKNPNGFFLMVEGGRIDHGHHDSLAKKALHDTVALEKAVTKALALTSEADTLIITTADHSHVFTIAGYPKRGNPLFGLVVETEKTEFQMADDNKPYTTLQYSNGQGAYFVIDQNVRPNLTGINTSTTDHIQQSGIPLSSETHGGEDVAIYARGPMSHLFHGTHEQHYIAHVMAYASCVGSYSAEGACAQADVKDQANGGVSKFNTNTLNFCLIFVMFYYELFVRI